MEIYFLEQLTKGEHNVICEQWIFRASLRRTRNGNKIQLRTEERKQIAKKVMQNALYLPRGRETDRMNSIT